MLILDHIKALQKLAWQIGKDSAIRQEKCITTLQVILYTWPVYIMNYINSLGLNRSLVACIYTIVYKDVDAVSLIGNNNETI